METSHFPHFLNVASVRPSQEAEMTGEYTAEDLRKICSHVRAFCDRVEASAGEVESNKLGSVLIDGAMEFQRALKGLISFEEGLQGSIRKRTVHDDLGELFTMTGGGRGSRTGQGGGGVGGSGGDGEGKKISRGGRGKGRAIGSTKRATRRSKQGGR